MNTIESISHRRWQLPPRLDSWTFAPACAGLRNPTAATVG